jgi:hypothetical protein
MLRPGGGQRGAAARLAGLGALWRLLAVRGRSLAARPPYLGRSWAVRRSGSGARGPTRSWIEWGQLPGGAAGQYQTSLNRITVGRTLEQEGFGVLAAVLAHEAYHAVREDGEGTAACYAEEADAAAWTAREWSSLPARWRTSGDWGDVLDALVRAWHDQRLAQRVSDSPGYQRQCGYRFNLPNSLSSARPAAVGYVPGCGAAGTAHTPTTRRLSFSESEWHDMAGGDRTLASPALHAWGDRGGDLAMSMMIPSAMDTAANPVSPARAAGAAGAQIWAAFVQRTPGQPWRLEGMSVLSAERARALAERQHARERVVAARFVVRPYDSPLLVPWALDPADAGRGASWRGEFCA